MAAFIPDDIDFSAYEQQTEFKAKVRRASDFVDGLIAQFQPRDESKRSPAMRSTKLRSAIEFRPGEVSVWAGYNGHRKSMLTGQVALDLIDQRQKVLVVSLEMPPEHTLARMAQQACVSNQPAPARLRQFMRWTDDRLWLFNHVGRLTPPKALALCRYFAAEIGGGHVFLDSFMKVCESEESMDEQKALIGNLCDLAKETGLHLHLVAHCRKPSSGDEGRLPTKSDIKGSGAISDQAHNVLLVWENKAKRAEADKQEPRPEVMAGPDGMVILDKQRNGKVEGKFRLWFDDRSLRFVDSEFDNPRPYDMEVAL